MAGIHHDHEEIEEHLVPNPVAPPAPEPEPIVVESDSEDEEVPEEGIFLEELDQALEAEDEEEDQQEDMEDAIAQLGAMVQTLMDQKQDLTARLQTSQNRSLYLEGQVERWQIDYHEQQNLRTVDLQRLEVADQRVRNLEQALRAYRRRADGMNYAYITSMERLQASVWTYPNEVGQFRHSISRARVVAIIEEERVSTISSARG